MDVRFQIVGIAVIVLLIILMLSFRYLSRRGRYLLYGFILLTAVGTWAIVSRNLNPATEYTLDLFASGLNNPVQALWGPDGSERFYVVSRQGTIHILEEGQMQDPPFLDIEQIVDSDGGEQGLLSVAFHPNFRENGLVYVYYTNLDDDTVLARYQIADDDPNRLDPESAVELLIIPQINTHHNGGALLFGPDGYLYLGVGNGGDEEMNGNSVSQDLTNHLGTILRFDVSDINLPYDIPSDNPFVDDRTALPEIWAYGLRNPWRMSFDSGNGDLYIADVGEGTREEINYQPAGQGAGVNYGWPWFEGKATTDAEGATTINPNDFVFPVVDYDHLALGGCSIIGGHVYHGQALPDLFGHYIYGDFCSGFVWATAVSKSEPSDVKTVLRDPTVRLASFAVDGEGEIYLLDVVSGNMFKIVKAQ